MHPEYDPGRQVHLAGEMACAAGLIGPGLHPVRPHRQCHWLPGTHIPQMADGELFGVNCRAPGLSPPGRESGRFKALCAGPVGAHRRLYFTDNSPVWYCITRKRCVTPHGQTPYQSDIESRPHARQGRNMCCLGHSLGNRIGRHNRFVGWMGKLIQYCIKSLGLCCRLRGSVTFC